MTLRLFTSESVTEGHPDKICDRISDAILDEMLTQDPLSRVAVETLVTTGLVVVAGEVTTNGYVAVADVVRREIENIGYVSSEMGFDAASCGVTVSIGEQSDEIKHGVDTALEVREAGADGGDTDELSQLGAGDQGLMFGYACTDTPELQPLPSWLAHRLAQRLTRVRKEGIMSGLRPDGKTQVTIGYDGDTPKTIDTIVVSTQHDGDLSLDELGRGVREHVIDPVLEQLRAATDFDLDTTDMTVLVNPAGTFTVGGPKGDAGLTGRKIIVDTYGGTARHGGGAFSGKDPTKVDRSAAYAMRWVAKHCVRAGLASRIEVQVAYAIGVAEPVGLYVEAFGTETVPVDTIQRAIEQTFDLRPASIIRDLDLRRPIYALTSAYGHFGRELPEFTWEQTPRVNELRQAAGLEPID